MTIIHLNFCFRLTELPQSKPTLQMPLWDTTLVIMWSNSDDIPALCDSQCNSRGDLRLHEDEDENQQSGQTAGEHHPDGEFTVCAERTDDPATFLGTRHRETSRNTQFLHRG